MTSNMTSRRSFMMVATAIAGASQLSDYLLAAEETDSSKQLMAYVGTFSSPLKDVLKTQVDLPPGNGRGIHGFRVNRQTGALTEAFVEPMGTSPSCVIINAAGNCLY